MAYAAVVSLELTIKRISNSSRISVVENSSPQVIDLLYKEVRSLQEVLKVFNGTKNTVSMRRVRTLEAEIRCAVCKFEDVFESHVSNQFLSQTDEKRLGQEIHPLLLSLDLMEIKQDIDSFIETVNLMKKAYLHELLNQSPEEEDDDVHVVPSRIDFGVNYESEMVGLSDFFMAIKNQIRENFSERERMTVALVGTAGIGKTTLAKKLFQDPLVLSNCSRRAFVTIGPKYQSLDVLLDIVKKVNPEFDETRLMEGEEKLGDLQSMLKDSLRNQRYLIVLDDVWNTGILDYLIKLFPDNNNGSQVLLTTRLQHVAKPRARGSSSCTIRLLNPKESWNLLRKKVFDEMQCPPQLEKAGKEIAEKCEGLPLTIVTVAHILSKADKTTEYWNEVASAKQHSVFMDAYERMCKVLYPSYDYLDQHLKACFLYMGAFPQTCWIRSSDLFNLWSAEGLPDSDEQFRERTSYPHIDMTLTDATTCCLLELNSKNVFLSENGVNFVRLYSPFWYLCNKEAAKNKFLYGLNTRADGLAEESLKAQRRLCIRNSILFSMEDVHNSMASVSNVRSLLCTGPDNQYPVPICLGLRLLRVLDALRIRLYEFPVQLLDLIQLRYLALTYQGNLPPTISKLWNLQFFIVSQYLSIISDKNSSYLPMQIWDMKELKYLQVTGSNLPHPSEGSLLPNLLTLRGVSAQSCTKHNFERIPNLEELKVQIELAPDVMEPLICFDHISHLNKLKVLRCTIVNPIFKTGVAAPLAPLADLPSTLVRMSLSGLGYPWEEMRKISSLPNLITLMLYDYAFRGPKWEVGQNEFRKLRTLKVEDTDLVQWTFRHNLCLSAIESITIGHCYKLKEIPLKFGKFLKSVDLVDCNPRAVTYAKMSKMLWKQEYPLNPPFHLNVHSS